jgi:hypothetical protein
MQKKDRQRMTYIVLFLVIILLISSFFMVQSSRKKQEQYHFDYNGFDVSSVEGGYQFHVFINQNQESSFFTLRSDPRTIENISMERGIKEDILVKEHIYVVIDPYANLTGVTTMAALEIDKIIENPFLFNIPVNTGFTKPYESVGLDVITCEDVNATLGVIWLRLGKETTIFTENNCVIIEGTTEDDLISAADKLVLVLLNIMTV